MGFTQLLARILQRRQQDNKPVIDCRPAPKAPISLLDCRPDVSESDITFGVKYTSRYGWSILPPAGWRREEGRPGPAWPAPGSLAAVNFTSPSLAPPEHAMIRWHLLSTPHSREAHLALDKLLAGTGPIGAEAVKGLEAPGLVAGMKVHKMERVDLPSAGKALLVALRLNQCRGEPPVLRYVLILPDREVTISGSTQWYRESLQFIATESSFFALEPVAIACLKSFKRGVDQQTTQSMVAFTAGGARY